MHSEEPNNIFTQLAYLSLLPLFLAVCISLYHALNLAQYTGYVFSFARINSYIYSHSYGALLLVFFSGIQTGQNLQTKNHCLGLFNFILLWLAWFSYHSFADLKGMLLLMGCWLAAFIIDLKTKQECPIPMR